MTKIVVHEDVLGARARWLFTLIAAAWMSAALWSVRWSDEIATHKKLQILVCVVLLVGVLVAEQLRRVVFSRVGDRLVVRWGPLHPRQRAIPLDSMREFRRSSLGDFVVRLGRDEVLTLVTRVTEHQTSLLIELLRTELGVHVSATDPPLSAHETRTPFDESRP